MSDFQANETPLKHKHDESDTSPSSTNPDKKLKTKGLFSLENKVERMEFQHNQDNRSNEAAWQTAGPNRSAKANATKQ